MNTDSTQIQGFHKPRREALRAVCIVLNLLALALLGPLALPIALHWSYFGLAGGMALLFLLLLCANVVVPTCRIGGPLAFAFLLGNALVLVYFSGILAAALWQELVHFLAHGIVISFVSLSVVFLCGLPFAVTIATILYPAPLTPIDDNHCVCGYDLTGNVTGVCPECGTPRTIDK